MAVFESLGGRMPWYWIWVWVEMLIQSLLSRLNYAINSTCLPKHAAKVPLSGKVQNTLVHKMNTDLERSVPLRQYPVIQSNEHNHSNNWGSNKSKGMLKITCKQCNANAASTTSSNHMIDNKAAGEGFYLQVYIRQCRAVSNLTRSANCIAKSSPIAGSTAVRHR